jgi:transposase
MDSDKRSAQLERLEVVDTGRRRRWSEDEKLKIVLESLRAPRQISATARRYGLLRSLLIKWREPFRPERCAPPGEQVGFVPAMVVAESVLPVPAVPARGEASSTTTNICALRRAPVSRSTITGTPSPAWSTTACRRPRAIGASSPRPSQAW